MADLTVKVLEQIRDEIKETRKELSTRIDITNDRLDITNDRVDRLEKRQTEMEIRLATELIAVAGAVRELRDAILEDRKLRETVSDRAGRVSALEQAASH